MPATASPDHALLKLAAIGTLAGLFSGLFGVGGGTIIVPLLIFWFGYGERLATGTSLAASVIIRPLGAPRPGRLLRQRPRHHRAAALDPRRARRRPRHRDPAAHPPAHSFLPLRPAP